MTPKNSFIAYGCRLSSKLLLGHINVIESFDSVSGEWRRMTGVESRLLSSAQKQIGKREDREVLQSLRPIILNHSQELFCKMQCIVKR